MYQVKAFAWFDPLFWEFTIEPTGNAQKTCMSFWADFLLLNVFTKWSFSSFCYYNGRRMLCNSVRIQPALGLGRCLSCICHNFHVHLYSCKEIYIFYGGKHSLEYHLFLSKRENFKNIILLLFNNSCLNLLPTIPPHPSHPHLHPLVFVHVSFIAVPENPCPLPPIIPSHFPMVTVRMFLISMSLVIFCLLLCFVD